MSRRRNATRRPIIPDPRYNNQLVSQLINSITGVAGHKTTYWLTPVRPARYSHHHVY